MSSDSQFVESDLDFFCPNWKLSVIDIVFDFRFEKIRIEI